LPDPQAYSSHSKDFAKPLMTSIRTLLIQTQILMTAKKFFASLTSILICAVFALSPNFVIAQEASVQDPKLQDSPGIATTKPESGQFVELPDGRFMIPYTEAIPGTDVKFEMVPIPGGTFKMGSPEDEEDRRDDEGPQVEVQIAPYWMGKYEVTWGEYKNFMRLDRVFKNFTQNKVRPVDENNRIDAVAAPSSLYDPSFTFDAGDGPNQPAATPTLFAARQYTKYISLLTGEFYRLPTESEWEYACRAGTTTRFYFGDDADDLENHAWYSDNSDDERHAIGELEPNPWGLHDMYGNVAEWVLDTYSEDGYSDLAEIKELNGTFYRKQSEASPGVVRGGSYELDAEDCRSAARMPSDDEAWKLSDPNIPLSPWWYTESPATGVGLRIIRPLEAPSDRLVREEFWKAETEDVTDIVRDRLEFEGKGALGVVDPELPKAIQKAIDDK
jgi:formylglycine-generating enzyme required for sulfatase activity